MQEHPISKAANPALSTISEAKRKLLDKYLRAEMTEDITCVPAIAPRPPGTIPQLSFAQERLWFLDQLNPDSALYNVPLAVRLSDPLDAAVLERSVNEIVRRHEALRTAFANVEGQPIPVVSAALKIDLQVFDLTSVNDADREAHAQTLLNEQSASPFDLTQGPLIRATLLKLSEREQIFLVVMHHIVSDGWSLLLFFSELSAIYEALSHGDEAHLAPVAVQYPDYAAWQREWLQGDLLETQLGYWKKKLSGDLAVLQLPTDRSRPAMQTFSGAREWLSLSEPLTTSLLALSKREGVTLFITLLAAFKTLLHRYTGDEDIIVGAPIANRPRTEVDATIGFFLNNLALRSDLSGDPTFLETLARVRQTALEAYAHQDVPFEKLIEAVKPQRDLSRTPIFQVYFNLFNFNDEVRLPGNNLKSVSFVEAWAQSEETLSKFDMTLYAGLQGDELKLAFVYNTDLFDAATIRQMLAHFEKLLEAVIAEPQRRISELSLLGESRKNDDVVRSGQVRPDNAFTEFPREEIEQSIADRFAAQVEKHSERVAIHSKNFEWTYRELSAAVDNIAQTIARLRGSGEERVALLFEHDAPMIAAMLGALKAGKTYVPLDPHHPEARLAQIIEHAQATAVLTNNRNLFLAHKLAGRAVPVINVDNLPAHSSHNGKIELPAVEPDRLAYILYTSGSTGEPKGVMQNHRNVLHYIRVYTNSLHLNADDRLTLLSSYCFDASVMDIYGALLNGATLYPVDIREDGLAELAQHLTDEAITVYHSTPTVYRYFLTALSEPPALAGGPAAAGQSQFRALRPTALSEPPALAGGPAAAGQSQFRALRLVVLGGEKVNNADVELYKQHFSDHCLFVNGLGPTEATVSLQNFVDKQTKISGESIPVGFPVEDTEVLLLNKAGQPAEVYGEIAIRSPHVALGYWRNPDATAHAFGGSPTVREGSTAALTQPEVLEIFERSLMVELPSNGLRTYRTGDMGRRLPDGSIKFEVRKDFQIKIRGFRVELGEIEAALAEHAQVREAVVVAKESAAGDVLLIAYVVAHDKSSPTNFSLSLPVERESRVGRESRVERESGNDKLKFVGQTLRSSAPSTAARREEATFLRDFLKQRLPEYMVPAAFVVLDSLPLTASGKLDRRALPAPDISINRAESVHAAPATAFQKSLASIWSDVLQVNAVGVNDNFFELGGHSLMAVRLFAQIEKKLGKRLPLATLFQAPTVAQLAAVIESGRQKNSTGAPWSSLVAINPIEGDHVRTTCVSGWGGPAGSGISEINVATARTAAREVDRRPPFFCVHALGGNVLEYYDLARHLGAEQPFYGLQSAGLDGSRPPHTRVEDMAAHYIKELREVQPHGPYFIGGRSLGGMVAFEMAQQLTAQGQTIGLLALLDTYPSGYAKLFRNEATLGAALRRGLKRTKAHFANLRSLSVQEGLSYLARKARFAPRKMKSQMWRRIYQSYENVGRPIPRMLKDIKEFNSLAVRDYAPRVYDGKVTLFWASADLRTSIDLVEGWRALAGGGIEVHEIPGSHLDIVKEPHVQDLAQKLGACLANRR